MSEFKKDCLDAIDAAAALLVEMKEMIHDPAPDAAQAFLEAAQDAQCQINRAIAQALIPVIRDRHD